ncbi:MAG: polysaccharide biosynthesis protein [Prevotella sp.]|nr:polysaccharide biosynthesis protein [Prevotella sp.]
MKIQLEKLVSWYFSRESLPYWCILIIDTVIVFVSGFLSYLIINNKNELIDNLHSVAITMLILSLLSWVGFRLFRTYSGIVRFSSFVDLMNVTFGNIVSVSIAIAYSFLMEYLEWYQITALSQTEIVATYVIATLLMCLMRIIVKTLYDQAFDSKRTMRVLIYGALSGGIGLAKMIRSQHPPKFKLCGFISHEPLTKHVLLMGKPVWNTNDDLATIIRRERIQAVLVSPQRLDNFRDNNELQDLIINSRCKIFILDQAKEASIKDGQLQTDVPQAMQLKEVSVEDLLPRSEITVDLDSIAELLKNKRVLITGSAGSIGSEMVRQVASFGPEKMMLIDQAETPEHDIRLMMENQFPDIQAETVVTTICDKERMDHIFAEFRPDYVFHAAAYKHVPMMEDNPSEAVKNNIIGTRNIADLSVKYGVKKFVMISTDKAVNPTNVMGCSKRICEIYVQSLDRSLRLESLKKADERAGHQNYTQFVTTRFGNVLGSNGSVIPLFQEQIRKGGPVTVTDERIVRFFMLIPEACKLVLEAGTKGNGGEIFVFDMGKPVRIADLAKRMIALSGAKGVEVKFTGLRQGEKLYEEVLNELEGTKPTFHKKIRIAEVREYDYEQVCRQIDELCVIAKKFDNMATVAKMKEIVPEYKSNNSVYEQLDKQTL